MMRVRQDLEERLEHLEVSLREEFQHVEVRCDVISREFNRLRGKEWKDGVAPTMQPLPEEVDKQMASVQQALLTLSGEMNVLRELSPVSSAEVSDLRGTIQAVETKLGKISEFKAEVEGVRGVVNVLQTQLPAQVRLL